MPSESFARRSASHRAEGSVIVSAQAMPNAVMWDAQAQALLLLDQTLLPAEERYLRLTTPEEVAEAIRSLRVRGAPAIGIAGAFGLVLGLHDDLAEDALREKMETTRGMLQATRPTGSNLGWALDRLGRTFDEAAGAGVVQVREALEREACAIAAEDEAMCRRIGEAGVQLFPKEGGVVLTHCNAGALATGGIGTALAPVYEAASQGIPVEVYARETRPLLQGARLTAWELERAGIPVTVIADSSAGALLAQGRVSLVIVGADRIAANGDVANKIGTYPLAVLARHHGVPFYVAVPRSTFDSQAPDGASIPIEERDGAELRGAHGDGVVPKGAEVWNPAFDVTPAHLVTAIVTDGGILRPPYTVTIRRLLCSVANEIPAQEGVDS